jgi:hypothetical protein
VRSGLLIPLILTAGTIAGQTQTVSFTKTVVPVLRKAGCPACHNHDGVASGTRVIFPETDAPAAEVERFGLSLQAVVDRTTPEKSLLFLKPTKRIAYAGGKRIKPGSPDEAVLSTWVNYLAKIPPVQQAKVTEQAGKQKPVLRRLTHAQYNNTVRDLLGNDSRLADQFPPEDYVNGFKNQFQSQSISPLLAEAYGIAAEKLARFAFMGGDSRKLIPCKPASASDRACADSFVRSFGAKAFRRPLLEPEVARYIKLLAKQAASSNNFVAGAQLVVEAMLQSPNFLLRTENGAEPKWRPYETASRLSYFLWNSMPDDKLFRAASSGQLNTPEGVERQTRRLLADAKARDSMNEFVEQWLRFDRLLNSVKDRRTFPQYTPELALAMTQEPLHLASNLIWNNGNFMEFFSADYAYLNSSLASLYKVPAPKTEFEKVALPPETERAGVFGQAVFLALTSKPTDTSPTARGLFVREQFLCQEVPQPPPGVSTNLPSLSKDKPFTNRERLAVHLNNEGCSSCHSLIDPIGFGFEKFDAIGQYREKLKLTFGPGRKEKDVKTVSVELPLNTEGDVAGIKDSHFSSPRGLGKILAGSERCQDCVVKQLFRYAAGRKEAASDRAIIQRSYEAFRDSKFKFQELMVALVKSIEFPSGVAEETNVSGSH